LGKIRGECDDPINDNRSGGRTKGHLLVSLLQVLQESKDRSNSLDLFPDMPVDGDEDACARYWPTVVSNVMATVTGVSVGIQRVDLILAAYFSHVTTELNLFKIRSQTPRPLVPLRVCTGLSVHSAQARPGLDAVVISVINTLVATATKRTPRQQTKKMLQLEPSREGWGISKPQRKSIQNKLKARVISLPPRKKASSTARDKQPPASQGVPGLDTDGPDFGCVGSWNTGETEPDFEAVRAFTSAVAVGCETYLRSHRRASKLPRESEVRDFLGPRPVDLVGGMPTLTALCNKMEETLARHLGSTLGDDGVRVRTTKQMKTKYSGTMLSLGWGLYRFGRKVCPRTL
jgi:hypothetical protein